MDFWNSLFGMVTLELTSADPESALLELQNRNIPLQDLIKTGQLQYRFRTGRRDVRILKQLAKKRGETLRIVGREGFFWSLKSLLKRPVLVLGMTAFLAFSLWVPGRVFFVRVEGNVAVPSAQIIEQAMQSGIAFGASRREVRSEKMKNLLLERMPALQWAGVNTYGCVAVITVRERSDPEKTTQSQGVSSIVAQRDAVVREVTVLQGNALCKPGQAVQAGEVLVSGYTDCGIYIQAQQAQAEIYGQTQRQMTAITPVNYSFRQEKIAEQKNFSMILGKKRINLWKCSGISGASCAKIETDYDLMLPGGFQLPVKLVVETVLSYDIREDSVGDSRMLLEEFAERCLLDQMIAGRIMAAGQVFCEREGVCRLDGIYDCYESIGITRSEESLLDYGENH